MGAESTVGYTHSELMAVVAAREIKDNEKVVVGIGLPMIAGFLAIHSQAPKCELIFEGGYIGGRPPIACTDVGDSILGYHASCATSLWRTLSDMQRGLFDLGIIGAAQIDKYGNVNSTLVLQKCKHQTAMIRLPGSGGANDIASSAKRLLIMTRLGKNRFVQKLDYLTSPGYLAGPGARERVGLVGKGPAGVVTDKAVFRFDEISQEMYLNTIYPGVTVEEVMREVGFALKVSPNLDVVAPPSREEVRFIRNFDPTDLILRRRHVLNDLGFSDWVRVTKTALKARAL